MELFISSFVIFSTVAISNILAQFVPHLSSTYVNLLLGMVVAAIPVTNQLVLEFNNEVFMILILAPLLFFEGQTTSILMVGKHMKSIIGTAVILAAGSAMIVAVILQQVFTVGVSLALILVAISTPTDATGFDSVITGHQFPSTVGKTLKLESLFNDATGIILLQAGLIWFQTGHLSFFKNITNFLQSSVGGIVIGIGLGMLVMLFRQRLLRSTVNVISSQTLIYLITPFVIYYLAEEVGASGIIAVVTAGLIHNSEAARSRFSAPRQMHLGIQLINFITKILNSGVFVILGITLERIFTGRYGTLPSSFQWLGMGILIYGLLFVLRYLYARITGGKHHGNNAVLFALGGVHGTVTLAMTFSIYGIGMTRATFNLVIIIETVVILLSMLVPTIVFKLILPIDSNAKHRASELKQMRHEMVAVGIDTIQTLDLSPQVCEIVSYDLRDQIQKNTLKSFLRQWRQMSANQVTSTELQSVEERRALMMAFDAQRKYLYQLAKKHQASSEAVYELYSEILLSESLVLDPSNQLI